VTFKPGQSGNPGGRPKELKQIQSLARVRSVTALEVLTQIATDASASASARVAAAIAILDRGWGKPAQAVQSTITPVDINSLSDEELVAIIVAGREGNSELSDDQGEPNGAV
jgi:hypothetical protein